MEASCQQCDGIWENKLTYLKELEGYDFLPKCSGKVKVKKSHCIIYTIAQLFSVGVYTSDTRKLGTELNKYVL